MKYKDYLNQARVLPCTALYCRGGYHMGWCLEFPHGHAHSVQVCGRVAEGGQRLKLSMQRVPVQLAMLLVNSFLVIFPSALYPQQGNMPPTQGIPSLMSQGHAHVPHPSYAPPYGMAQPVNPPSGPPPSVPSVGAVSAPPKPLIPPPPPGRSVCVWGGGGGGGVLHEIPFCTCKS
jgi:hypothetical protein